MRTKKRAVVTIKIGYKVNNMAKQTVPLMSAYADRVGAELIVIDKLNSEMFNREYAAYWAKFELYDLLGIYDRIIYIDLDAIVYPDCPNLFDIVPDDAFGALFENDYGARSDDEICEFQTRVGNIDWHDDYFNVGVMVISKCHREAFKLNIDDIGGARSPEQTRLNYNVQRLGFRKCRLDYKFNHMIFLEVNDSFYNNRDESYITHFAAVPQEWRDIIIENDIRRFSLGEKAADMRELRQILREKYTESEIKNARQYALLRNIEIGII